MDSQKKNYEKAKLEQNYGTECKRKDSIVNNITEGTAVCKFGGGVKEDHVIDETSEWRNFGNDGSGKSDGSKSSGDRTGGNWNTDLDSFGMEGMITGGEGGDKLNKLARRQQTSHDRNVKMAMGSIKHYANMLNLSKAVQEMVKNLYSSAEKTGKLKGKPMESKIAAMIYMASKIANRPKNLREIIRVSQSKRKDVTRGYKILAEFMPHNEIKTNMAEGVTNLCSRTHVSSFIEEAARGGVEIVGERELLTGRNPNTIAGACLYLISAMTSKPLEFKDVAEAAQLAESTIRENYRRLYEHRADIVPKWFTAKLSPEQLPKE